MKGAGGRRGLATNLVPALFALLVGVLAVAAWTFHADIRRQIEDLGIANSDSTQWFLAQSEVEALALERAILLLRAEPGVPERADDVRRRFDIFYSRVQTLRTGQAFANLRALDGVAPVLDDLQARLEATVPLIDGDDAPLVAALDMLEARFGAALPLVRQVSLAGVRQFAGESDGRRQHVVLALFQLLMLVVPLFLVLVCTTVVLFVMGRAARVQTERIAAAGDQMRSLFDASTDAILFARPDGRVRGYNKAARRLYGYEPDEVIGGDLVELLTPPEQRGMARALLAGVQQGRARGEGAGAGVGAGAEVIQSTAQHKSGRIVPVEMSWAIASDRAGPLLVAFVRDVSRRVQQEAELTLARDRAVAGEKAKARMIAVMSHEMRTPLNGILGTLDLLKLTPLQPGQQQYLAAMEQSGRMLLRHVNDVLDASRAAGGATAGPLDPAAIVRGTVAGLQAHAQARGNRITVDVTGDHDGLLYGNATQIEQILVNLVGNAIKFTENGLIQVELDRSGGPGQVELRVSDSGIGIAEEDLSRIFDEFVTLCPTFDRTVPGTGLGLSIVKTLVEAMHGRIEVASEPGQGTVFSVTFDLPPATGPVPVPAPPAAVPTSGSRRVLVVDDNAINRLVVGDMLRLHGCEVTEAEDGLSGCGLAAARPFDLILMDISMPRLNGVEAARRIRQSGPNAATPIIALTAHAMPEDIARFREAGMERVLVKPLQLADLTAVLAARPALAGPSPSLVAGSSRLSPDLMDRIVCELRSGVGALAGGAGDRAALAHRLAGSAALGGFSGLHGALVRLEQALRGGADKGDTARQIADLSLQFDRCLGAGGLEPAENAAS
ncbi:ATP-binding protein [Paracoccus sp. WLY502]|uniref:hybrid sensor histidine kinase/response regulator n=1 Tax=Paracoccus yibinensis TaxID=3068891 RepID=UPI002796949A|nr:ATP-binding protein [Paracoccus sp. WLY502]MDQ1901194.1 ATP-binding protein [Paracoccus sp. WLY502]